MTKLRKSEFRSEPSQNMTDVIRCPHEKAAD